MEELLRLDVVLLLSHAARDLLNIVRDSTESAFATGVIQGVVLL